MSLAHTHAELNIVCRILQQASIPISQSQFDQLWTRNYLKQCFQWTNHLAGMLSLSASDIEVLPRESDRSAPLKKMDLNNTHAIEIVKSYLSRQKSNLDHHQETTVEKDIDDTLGIPPTLDELLNPTEALQQRLCSNPGLSNMAIMEIIHLGELYSTLTTSSSVPSNHIILSTIKENAIESLLDGVQSHFLLLEKMAPSQFLTSDLDVVIDRKTKASVIFSRLCDPNNPLNVDALFSKLNEYMEMSRNEALEVIKYLSDMIFNAQEQSLPGVDIDWKALYERLSAQVIE